MPKATTYNKDIESKIKKGEPWRFHFVVDPDVAKKVLEEMKASTNGAEYGKIMNARLRKAYKLKP